MPSDIARRADKLLDKVFGPVPGAEPEAQAESGTETSTEKLLRLLNKRRRRAIVTRRGL